MISILIIHNYPVRNRAYLGGMKQLHPVLKEANAKVTVCKLYRHPELLKVAYDLIYIDEDTVNSKEGADWVKHFPRARVRWVRLSKQAREKNRTTITTKVKNLKEKNENGKTKEFL